MDAVRRRARRLAAVVGELDGRRRPVHTVGVLRIDAYLRVVKRAHVTVVHPAPRLAAVRRAIEAAQQPLRAARPRVERVARRLQRPRRGVLTAQRVRLDERVDHVGIASRHRESDTSLSRLRESAALHLAPRLTAVGRRPERRARPAALQEVRTADALVARRPEHVRIRRMDHDVDETGALVDELDEPPVLAAVGRLVQTALPVRPPCVPERGNPRRIRIVRVDDDAPDLLRLGEPDELPRLPAVGGLEDSAARRDRVARVLLARAGVDHVRVGWRDRQRPHRDDALVVEDWLEGRSRIRRLVDPAGDSRDVERLRRTGNPRDVADAAAHVRRPDRTPAERGERRRVE